jgi:hypothetical protein
MVQAHLSRIRAHVTANHDSSSLNYALTVIDDVAGSLGIGGEKRAAIEPVLATAPA